MDNATIHCQGDATNLDKWLWNEHKIFVLYLLTQSPKLNPIKKLWNVLLQRMKQLWRRMEGFNNLAIKICDVLLDHITHKDVYKCYQSCGYFN